MKIFVIEKVKPGEHKELLSYESDFVPSVGDIMASSLFTDLEHRIVVERMIIPTTNTIMIYCNPPYPTKFYV